MHHLSLRVYFVETAREEHRTVQAGVERAQVVDVVVFYLYLAHFTVPYVSSAAHQLVESLVA